MREREIGVRISTIVIRISDEIRFSDFRTDARRQRALSQ
jgi:hypothetical protein